MVCSESEPRVGLGCCYETIWFMTECDSANEFLNKSRALTLWHRTPHRDQDSQTASKQATTNSWTFLGVFFSIFVLKRVRVDLYESLNSSFVECRLTSDKKKDLTLRRIPNGAERSHQTVRRSSFSQWMVFGVWEEFGRSTNNGVSLCRDEQILNSSSLSAHLCVCVFVCLCVLYFPWGCFIFFFSDGFVGWWSRGGGK